MAVGQPIRDAEIAFLNAPFHPDGWHAAVCQLAIATGSDKAQLIGIGGPRTQPFNVISQIPSDPHGHLTNMALHGSVNWRICTTEGAGSLQHEADYAAYRAIHDTADYDDACSDLDGLYGCQMALMMGKASLVGLALMRSRRDGPCDSQAIEAFGPIARQALKAVRVQLALGQDAAGLMLDGIAARVEATILLDPLGQVAAMTPAAERLFDHPHGLRLEGLTPRLADAAEQRSFEAAMVRLFASDGVTGPMLHEARVGRSMERPEGRWRLHAVRLPSTSHAFDFNPRLAVTLTEL